jgi:hypothetical protein
LILGFCLIRHRDLAVQNIQVGDEKIADTGDGAAVSRNLPDACGGALLIERRKELFLEIEVAGRGDAIQDLRLKQVEPGGAQRTPALLSRVDSVNGFDSLVCIKLDPFHLPGRLSDP